MRILLITGSFPPMKCGVGDYTAHLAVALSRRTDTEVAVLTDVLASPIPCDFEFRVFPVCRGWRMRDVPRIRAQVRQWKPDIIHIQYPTQGYGRRYLPWLLPSLFRIVGIPVVQTWHGYDSRRMGLRWIPNSALTGGLIFVRPEYMDMMSPLYRWLNRRKHLRFIPNAYTIPPTQLENDEKADLRLRFSRAASRLVVFFGFTYADRGVEFLFQIADPAQDHLVLISDLKSTDTYHKAIVEYTNREPWMGKVTVTGYLPAEEVGRILAAADAIVLPFRDGGGMWNTSIRAGIAQGTFVLTTARERRGYDSDNNVYYARPDDVVEMREALRKFVGRRNTVAPESVKSVWDSIAHAHTVLYESVVSRSVQKSSSSLLDQK
jgi:glycosyltransferase involved in cell wall biosynthesis